MSEPAHTARIVSKDVASDLFAGVLLVIGVPVLIFTNIVVGGILVLVALGISFATRPTTICGTCGNQISPSSRMCPCCSVQFTHTHTHRHMNGIGMVFICLLTALGIMGAAFWVITQSVH